MERYLIFAFILLAALSMVNAMPAIPLNNNQKTSFGPCPHVPPPSPLSVKLDPDPIIAGNPTFFAVSGKVNEDIPSNSVLSVEFIDSNGEPIIPKSDADLCSSPGITCPILGGTEFGTEVKFSAPNDLPASYEIKVFITDPANSDPSHYLGCALSAVGFTSIN